MKNYYKHLITVYTKKQKHRKLIDHFENKHLSQFKNIYHILNTILIATKLKMTSLRAYRCTLSTLQKKKLHNSLLRYYYTCFKKFYLKYKQTIFILKVPSKLKNIRPR